MVHAHLRRRRGLIIIGMVFCYLIILNPAFQWITDRLARPCAAHDLLHRHHHQFEFGFGFAFELPLIVFYLVISTSSPYKETARQLAGPSTSCSAG